MLAVCPDERYVVHGVHWVDYTLYTGEIRVGRQCSSAEYGQVRSAIT